MRGKRGFSLGRAAVNSFCQARRGRGRRNRDNGDTGEYAGHHSRADARPDLWLGGVTVRALNSRLETSWPSCVQVKKTMTKLLLLLLLLNEEIKVA